MGKFFFKFTTQKLKKKLKNYNQNFNTGKVNLIQITKYLVQITKTKMLSQN